MVNICINIVEEIKLCISKKVRKRKLIELLGGIKFERFIYLLFDLK